MSWGRWRARIVGRGSRDERGIDRRGRSPACLARSRAVDAFGSGAVVATPDQDKDDNQLKMERRMAKSSEMANGPSLKGLWRRGGSLPGRLTSTRISCGADGPVANGRFFLVEAWWMASWRTYHDSSSIHSDPPPTLLNQVKRAPRSTPFCRLRGAGGLRFLRLRAALVMGVGSVAPRCHHGVDWSCR